MKAQLFPRIFPVERQFQLWVISSAEQTKTGLNGCVYCALLCYTGVRRGYYCNSFFTTGSARSAHVRICTPE